MPQNLFPSPKPRRPYKSPPCKQRLAVDKFVVAVLAVSALSSLAPIEQSQAQLLVSVYPSQDDTNQTLWIFSGSSTTSHPSTTSIRSSGNYNNRDTLAVGSNYGDLYNANRPSNQLVTLSPLFSSTNTIDIDSVRARIPGGGRTNITFAANATNAPSITIAGRGTRTIARLFMSENARSVLGQPPQGWLEHSHSSAQPALWQRGGFLLGGGGLDRQTVYGNLQ